MLGAHRLRARFQIEPTKLGPPACTEDLRHESEMAKSLVASVLLWAQPVALLLLSARQPLIARPLRQPLFAPRGAPLLQEKMPKGELVPSDDDVATGETKLLTAADEEAVGLLVEDEEWLGLGTEMFIVLRSAMRESLKKNVREFTGSDESKLVALRCKRTGTLTFTAQPSKPAARQPNSSPAKREWVVLTARGAHVFPADDAAAVVAGHIGGEQGRGCWPATAASSR